ncbi:kynurenine--oxoglutarate transaminase 1 [Echinops telfairi]|uniref:Kynurenine--oxoglutarate transaminase 1 n=1 Tax=Echinops telfairi TaxID=9371 RepID=A0AC55CY89_ECHTE|nr:kynurenine--oxoglutarate transaminase 1 [Echinops telfairi]
MFRKVAAIFAPLVRPLCRRKAGATSLTRCLHQTGAMAKQLQARRLDGIDKNPWVELTKLASDYGTVNLGQGFPDFAPPDFAVEAFQRALSEDYMLNQYTKAFVSPPALAALCTQARRTLTGHIWSSVSQTSLPGMWHRTLTIGSAGKTFSATGWKVGWVLGPEHLVKHLHTVHQNSVYHCATQAQAAVALSLEREQQHFGQPSSYFVQLPEATQHKRDHMIRSLQSVGMRPIIPQGSYFLIADISDFKSKMPNLPGATDEAYDSRFVKWMCRNKGLAAIPVSIFYSGPHQKLFDHYVRFCFIKDEATLQAMDEKLQKWKAELTP